MKRRSLPLGIDVGHCRVRIAALSIEGDAVVLERTAAFDVGDQTGAAAIGARIDAERRRLGIRERRCVLSLGEPEATLRSVCFPPMPARERARAARFEARRFYDGNDETTVQTAPIDASRGIYAVGIAPARALRARLETAQAARLRAVAVDHDAYAFRRVFPFADAVLDIGARRTRLYAYGENTPAGISIDAGSESFTAAIARSLGTDLESAERRKRTAGLAGAGDAELGAFAYSVGRALLWSRTQGVSGVARIVLTGNGARLPGLAARLERDTGCRIEVADRLAVAKSPYPYDALRAGAPDWALAVGLATWTAEPERAA
jgi:Tfp pilus assembly PilM family ATPase